MGRLQDARVLVTGGSSGIGEATVARLRDEGARVALTGRDRERGEAVAARYGATFLEADARDREAIRRSVGNAVEVLGGLDAAVLNAGVIHDGPLTETDDDAWDGVMETNLVAPYRYAVACLPHLRAAGNGAIVITSSDAGVWAESAIGAYSVSKRGAIMLARMLAVEAGPQGVRVNAVCPGDTEPGMVTRVGARDEKPDTASWIRPPRGRLVQASDVAAAVAFLISPDAAMVTGTELLVDGGMRAALHASAVHQGARE
jgi:NAD(P)-dependent dehydrogenase (short-subunit alcohol dehydrogenase family)